MNKPLKYTLLGLGGLVAIAVAGAAVFALTFDPNRYKADIERLAKEKTGRTLSIKGDIKMAFWPSLGADIAGVSLTEKGLDILQQIRPQMDSTISELTKHLSESELTQLSDLLDRLRTDQA